MHQLTFPYMQLKKYLQYFGVNLHSTTNALQVNLTANQGHL